MSAPWGKNAATVLVRDLLRDFCEVYATVTGQKARYAASGTVSHAVLGDLLGRQMQRGVFWRLQDTSSRLFHGRGAPLDMHATPGGPAAPAGIALGTVEQMLDWCFGYAFHECLKLKEDAFLRQHFGSRLTQLATRAPVDDPVFARLACLPTQTRESMGREVERILQVLGVARDLLIDFLRGKGDNGYVARYLVAEEALAALVFGEQYPTLLEALYGGELAARMGLPKDACPGVLPTDVRALVAAQASLEVGRPREALDTLDAIGEAARQCAAVRTLRARAEAAPGARPPAGAGEAAP